MIAEAIRLDTTTHLENNIKNCIAVVLNATQ